MVFSLNRTESPLSRHERFKINENWKKLEGIVDVVSTQAFEKVVDAAKLIWLAPVDTFADLATTYPNAVEGNAAMAKDTGIVYRYDGSQWKPIQQIDATAINEVDTRLTAEMSENMETVSSFTLYPQSPKPPKSGLQTCSPKIVWKTAGNKLIIIQRTNKGYVKYILQKDVGASQEGRDYGVNHELIRLVGAYQMQDAYVYADVSNPIEGALSPYYAPAKFNTFESYLFRLPQRSDEKTISSKNNGDGLGAYVLPAGASATYEIDTTENTKANLLIMATVGGTRFLDIYVNGILSKTVNPRSLITNGATPTSPALIEFDIPTKPGSTGEKISIKIVNNDDQYNSYICALNFFRLKDYNYQVITDFKVFGSSKGGWIENNGSSDYAIYDADKKLWFGSYHGGEISELDRLLWTSSMNKNDDYRATYTPFINIPIGEWRIQKSFNMYQQTSLADGKAKMLSQFNWDTDGTMDMDFSYYNGSVSLSTFYTALTCTATNFHYLLSPQNVYFGAVPSNTIKTYPITEGRTSQINSIDTLQLDLRFTKFNHAYDSRGLAISDNDAYRKVYYGPIYGQGNNPLLLNSVTFSKSIDFIVR
ncbi:hypothetical protein SFC08_04445 [Lysinibacillus halotolerans]